MNLVSSNFHDLAALTSVIAGDMAACIAELFQNDFEPAKDSVFADFEVCDYTGYATKVPTWSAPSIGDDGLVETLGTMSEWRPTGTAITNLVYGIVVKKAVTFEYLFAARFDAAPLPMASAMDVILTTLRIRQTASGLVVVIS